MSNYPLIVLATETENSVLREWAGIARMMALQSTGLIAIILFAAGMLSRWLYQQDLLNAAESKRDSAERARTLAEAELLHEQSLIAAKANKAKSAFLAVMSHEMRTPLNGIIGALDLLKHKPLPDDHKALVTSALNAGEALLTHINDILDYSKMEAGKLNLDPAPVTLRELLPTILTIIDAQVQKAGNRLNCDIAADVPAHLMIDPVRLRQLLLNLLSNANKFTHNGDIWLTIRRTGGTQDQPLVEFAVRDSGQGIPADRIDCLFKEFSMVDSSYARNAGGTGLGLAICKRLVNLMNGEIGVESEFGCGSRFWFRLPLAVCEPENAAARQDDTGDAQPPTAQVTLDVLLVDDNATNRFVPGQMLEALGHKVSLAENGLEAVAHAKKHRFDVIFMDVSMPEMDGLEATRRIRVMPEPLNTVPIIALTANAAASDKAEFMAAGMNDYLSKPVRKTEIAAALARVRIPTPVPATDGRAAAQDTAALPQALPDEIAAQPIHDPSELETLAAETSLEFIPDIVDEYLVELDARLDEYETARSQGDLAKRGRMAHAIAGGAAAVGALRLRHLTKAIEAACKSGDRATTDTLDALLADTAMASKAALLGYGKAGKAERAA